MMTELRRLLSEGTPGPWAAGAETVQDSDHCAVASCWLTHEGDHKDRSEQNARLIVAAINALPALLDVVEAAERWTAMTADTGTEEAIEIVHAMQDAMARLEGGT